MKRMLVVTTEQDDSIKLFNDDSLHIDFIYYDDSPEDVIGDGREYGLLYFRDPFNTGSYSMKQIDRTVSKILRANPNTYSVDGITSAKDLLIEDKWVQAKLFGLMMPHTKLLEVLSEVDFTKSFVKKRISSRARGVIFSEKDFPPSDKQSDYIVQDKLLIKEEYRVHIFSGECQEQVLVKTSKTASSRVKFTKTINIPADVKKFSDCVLKKMAHMDLIGLDVARVKKSDDLVLVEVNRSPQIMGYFRVTEQNLFPLFVKKLLENLSK